MKNILAVLFLCSVAVGQDAAVQPSSQPITVEQANILLQMRESNVHSMAMSEIGKKAHDQTVDNLLSQFWHENCDHPVNISMAHACYPGKSDEQLVRMALAFKEEEPTKETPKKGTVPEPCSVRAQ